MAAFPLRLGGITKGYVCSYIDFESILHPGGFVAIQTGKGYINEQVGAIEDVAPKKV
jgi:hypothetical protein